MNGLLSSIAQIKQQTFHSCIRFSMATSSDMAFSHQFEAALLILLLHIIKLLREYIHEWWAGEANKNIWHVPRIVDMLAETVGTNVHIEFLFEYERQCLRYSIRVALLILFRHRAKHPPRLVQHIVCAFCADSH